MRALLFNGVLLASCVLICGFSLRHIEHSRSSHPPTKNSEVLYLPSGAALELMSFGYKKVLAHILWFNSISYFAKHYRGDKDYTWLQHMCGLVTELNPEADYVYRFCGTMLAWEGNRPEESIKIFDAALKHHPNEWIFYYLRGFTYVFFLQNEAAAHHDFVKAASFPEAHPAVIALASKKILSLDSPEAAIQFLSEMINNTRDEQSRKAFISKLREAQYENGFQKLELALKQFEEKFARKPDSMPELIASGLVPPEIISSDFRDPYSGKYYYDSQSSQIKSSSNKKRPKLYWKRHQDG